MNNCGLGQIDEVCQVESSFVDLKFEKEKEVTGAKSERMLETCSQNS